MVNTAGEGADVALGSGAGNLEESLHHTSNGTQETDHGRTGGCGSEPVEAFLQLGNLHVAHVLDGDKHIVHWATYAAHAFLNHSGIWGVGVLAQLSGLVHFTAVDEVLDFLHESGILLRGAVHGEQSLKEDVEAHDGQQC